MHYRQGEHAIDGSWYNDGIERGLTGGYTRHSCGVWIPGQTPLEWGEWKEIDLAGMDWFTCDRCDDDVQGLDTHTTHGTPVTVGFYRFLNHDNTDSIWAEFRQGIEELVCRRCMWSDEKFLDKYPHLRNPRIRELIVGKGMK